MSRINLTKKDLINSIYMQIGFSKTISENLIDDFLTILIDNLKKFKARLDPRLYNGAIFIGLDSPVIKSHGGTDYIGFSNSLSVCSKTVTGNLIEKITNNIN